MAAPGRNRAAANLFRDRRARAVSDDDDGVVTVRTSARVVLLDEAGPRAAVLRVRPGDEPTATAPKWWFTVGGQARPGRRCSTAAAREVHEETGLLADPDEMIGPVWRRDAIIDFNNSVIRSHELFFVHRTAGSTRRPRATPRLSGATSTATAGATPRTSPRWCDAGRRCTRVQLGELLAEANALADARTAPERREPQPIR